jgi:retron-type reverse transcriptase
MAVAKAEAFINRYGLKHVVDMDLSKCFDRLDHELMLQAVNRRISDGRVLALIRQFLEAGVVADGSWEETEIGSPQGGVISPLLCNIYLDAFDREMMAPARSLCIICAPSCAQSRADVTFTRKMDSQSCGCVSRNGPPKPKAAALFTRISSRAS